MAERSTASTFAEIMVPVAAGAVILGAVATLIWLANRSVPGPSLGRGADVDPRTSYPRKHARKLTRQAFTEGDDPGYDLDVEGEDVT